jgi:hypothetical protein
MSARFRGTHVAASGPGRSREGAVEEMKMLETIAIILIVLWLLGMVSGSAVDGSSDAGGAPPRSRQCSWPALRGLLARAVRGQAFLS